MSQGTNSTVSYPGPHWHMLWGNGPIMTSFQLDIVGFLAILGEGAVAENAQVSALSRLVYLPRLLPAPQAFLWPNRPNELKPSSGTVTGVFSGIHKTHVHHVANVLLGREMPAFTVRCVRVTKKPPKDDPPKEKGFKDIEKNLRTDVPRSMKQSFVAWVTGDTETTAKQDTAGPRVKNKSNGPLAWVTAFGCFLSIALFIISIVLGDGMSLLATILLSLLSTLVGVVNKSVLELPRRVPADQEPPDGDLVVRYPNGSFLVVRCKEEIARELYSAPEEIIYSIKSPGVFRLWSLVGTVMLMFGVIFLANSKLQLQFAWAGAYISLNAGHWIAAALPQRWHWDLSCYDIMEEGLSDGPQRVNFTDALWHAIVLTKSSKWVQTNNAAPRTPVWDQWVKEAEVEAKKCGGAPGEIIDRKWPEVPKWEFWNRKKKEAEIPKKDIVWEVPKWNARARWGELNKMSWQKEQDAIDMLKSPESPTTTTGARVLPLATPSVSHRRTS